MTERRQLIAGVRPAEAPVDPALEKQFVYGGRGQPQAAGRPPARDRLTTRVRADYVAALKRLSLERQLAGVTPHTVQEFLEEALGPWLEKNGPLP